MWSFRVQEVPSFVSAMASWRSSDNKATVTTSDLWRIVSMFWVFVSFFWHLTSNHQQIIATYSIYSFYQRAYDVTDVLSFVLVARCRQLSSAVRQLESRVAKNAAWIWKITNLRHLILKINKWWGETWSVLEDALVKMCILTGSWCSLQFLLHKCWQSKGVIEIGGKSIICCRGFRAKTFTTSGTIKIF